MRCGDAGAKPGIRPTMTLTKRLAALRAERERAEQAQGRATAEARQLVMSLHGRHPDRRRHPGQRPLRPLRPRRGQQRRAHHLGPPRGSRHPHQGRPCSARQTSRRSQKRRSRAPSSSAPKAKKRKKPQTDGWIRAMRALKPRALPDAQRPPSVVGESGPGTEREGEGHEERTSTGLNRSLESRTSRWP